MMRLLRILFYVALATGLAAPHAQADVSYDFDADDGGFTVDNVGSIESPWRHSSASGVWRVLGSANVGAPTSSGLRTNTYQLDADGSLDLSFDHRYSFEYDGTRWDGGALMYRVNDNGFRYVDDGQFTSEGYVGEITGNNALNGLEAFNEDSDGFADRDYITSVVQLGNFSAGDKVQVEFLGAWDEFARGSSPNWEIDSLTVAGQVTVVPDLAQPLFVGGEGTIGQDVYQGTRSNEVIGPPQAGAPGFTGRIVTFSEHQVTLDTHTAAEDVLDDYEGETAIAPYPVVDMAGGAGTFGENLAYPNGINDTSQSDFAVEVTADVVIPAGTWSIGIGSDDGGNLRIPGVVFDDFQNNDSFEDDEIRFEAPRAHGWTVGTFELNEELTTTLTGQFYERGGGDSFEIAVIDDELIEDPNPANDWELLGDGVFGWSVTTTSTLASADLSAEVEVIPSTYYRFDIDADTGQSDQMVLRNPDPNVYTTILDIDGATFQIAATGALADGDRFGIVDADQILGTPIITSRDPAQTWDFDPATGEVCFNSCGGGILGDPDYNGDGVLDALDLDLQAAEMKKPLAEQDLAKFDHNGDGMIDVGDAGPDTSKWGDRMIWIREARQTAVGDTNMDGVFDSGDLVLALQGSKYAVDAGNAEMATWIEGDWNGDMVFDSGDLVFAFQDGQYVAAATAAVPEPSGLGLILLGLGLVFTRARRRS